MANIPTFIKNYKDNIIANGLLKDSADEYWNYQQQTDDDAEGGPYWECRFMYLGPKASSGGFSGHSSGRNLIYRIQLKMASNPRFRLTVQGTKEAWQEVTADTLGNFRYFREWERSGARHPFDTNREVFLPESTMCLPWYMCHPKNGLGQPTFLGPWLPGWNSREEASPWTTQGKSSFTWAINARSDVIFTPPPPSAGGTFVANIQSTLDVPPAPPTQYEYGPDAGSIITHNGTIYSVTHAKAAAYGKNNIWAVLLTKQGSASEEAGFKGPKSKYVYQAGYYDWEYKFRTEGELVTDTYGNRMKLKLMINKEEDFEVYYFDTHPSDDINQVPLVPGGTTEDFLQNAEVLEVVDMEPAGAFSAYACLNAQEVLSSDPFGTSDPSDFGESTLEEVPSEEICTGDDCTECGTCPETCYECKVFADGTEVEEGRFTFSKEGDECSCRLAVVNLYAKRCRGEVTVTGDLLDSSGFNKNFCSIIDDTNSSSIKVRCNKI